MLVVGRKEQPWHWKVELGELWRSQYTEVPASAAFVMGLSLRPASVVLPNHAPCENSESDPTAVFARYTAWPPSQGLYHSRQWASVHKAFSCQITPTLASHEEKTSTPLSC